MGIASARLFSMADQEAFARLSGDRNPIHLDEIAARRTQAGAAVVHGVHGMLWALECAARVRSLEGLCTLSARFNRFVFVGSHAETRLRDRGDGVVAEIVVQGQAMTTIKLEWGPPRPPSLTDALFPGAAALLGDVPDEPPFSAMASLSGRVATPPDALAAQMFPALSVVGMSCPGLHSLFSQLDLRRVEGAPGPGLGWRTTRTDARARWVVLDVAGAGWEGAIISLARPEPVQAPSMADLSQGVDPGEFGGRKALIIGGSRGLGAVTGKLLAAGGAQVILTYAQGAADTQDLASEINTAKGPQACVAAHLDVTADVAGQLSGLQEGITHLYYFATPRISRQNTDAYDRETLDAFLAVYVDGFAAVWNALSGRRPLSVLYPSTIFLEDRPKGMTEYVMAKAAAEMLCADLVRRAPGVALMVPRIPRVLTDQTATLPPLPTADPVAVMLPLLRAQ
jgi:NAD(P)-dependent dehydrogenase (short-subunit alcohol dehydrogenase family)